MTNLPSIDDMLVALDAKALDSQEAWQRVAKLSLDAMERTADALRRAKLALEDDARLREKLMATLNAAEQELTETANQHPQAIAGQ